MARVEKAACAPGDPRCYVFPDPLEDARQTCTPKGRWAGSLAEELLTPDHVYHDPQIPNVVGPQAMAQAVAVYQTSLNGHWNVEELVAAEGDRVVARWTGTGTHTDGQADQRGGGAPVPARGWQDRRAVVRLGHAGNAAAVGRGPATGIASATRAASTEPAARTSVLELTQRSMFRPARGDCGAATSEAT